MRASEELKALESPTPAGNFKRRKRLIQCDRRTDHVECVHKRGEGVQTNALKMDQYLHAALCDVVAPGLLSLWQVQRRREFQGEENRE